MNFLLPRSRVFPSVPAEIMGIGMLLFYFRQIQFYAAPIDDQRPGGKRQNEGVYKLSTIIVPILPPLVTHYLMGIFTRFGKVHTAVCKTKINSGLGEGSAETGF